MKENIINEAKGFTRLRRGKESKKRLSGVNIVFFCHLFEVQA